ncbi:D-tyrosyl-tRNA(Tyr) deacylase [Patescibacteria group bacterium]|nr:D-tyrosyl-tRNA(Tyr) deacylase [Patescibacteria group bacterium]
MRAIIQRVTNAKVKTKQTSSQIGKGFLVLIAATHTDTPEDAKYLGNKIANLRIMADEHGKMNRSLSDEKGEVLVVSQFTLYARTRKGNRPSFIDAAEPDKAKALYGEFLRVMQEDSIPVKTGTFGEYMQVSLTNDGPVTIIIDSRERNRPRKQSQKGAG